MYFLGILVWVAVVATLARLTTIGVKNSALRASLVVLAVPLSFVLALADEIVGGYQFERLCEEAKEVRLYGTIPVGEELYTHDGSWRLNSATADSSRLGEVVEALVRWDHGGSPPNRIPGAIDIYQFNTRLYERKSDRLLAEWRVLTTLGGWLSRQLGGQVLVRPRCDPPITNGWSGVQQVLRFEQVEEKAK